MNQIIQSALIRSFGHLTCSKELICGRLPNELKDRAHVSLGMIVGKKIVYKSAVLKERDFLRFDFSNEWNNLGFGPVIVNDPIWGIADPSIPDFMRLYDLGDKAILWINRSVGNVDGLDWNVVEEFFENYRKDELGSLPYKKEIPQGFDAAVTMRIDCDENIASGRALFNLYKEEGVPFSLALKTSLDINESENKKFIFDVMDAGGAICSHSHMHYHNWGGSYEVALEDAKESRRQLKKLLGHDVKYLVSPFHENPLFAIKAIKDAGFEGVTTGIIHNDPEFLIARSGNLPFVDDLFSFSSQCMLHGDCYHLRDNSIQIYKDSFLNHMKTKTLFGYLDHPFSNYKYGWHTEEERIGVHREFLHFMKSNARVKFFNMTDAFEFLRSL